MISSWPLVVYSIYVPVLFLLYIVEVVLINLPCNRKLFASSYFRFFTIAAIVDLLTIVVTFMSHRILLYPGVNSFAIPLKGYSAWWITANYALSYYLPASQEYINIFIALNRATAVIKQTDHERVVPYILVLDVHVGLQWWRWIFWPSLLVIFGLPFITCYHLIDVSSFYVCFPLGENGTADTACAFDYDHYMRPWKSNSTYSILYTTTGMTSLCIYIATSAILRWRLRSSTKAEVRLLLLGFVVFVCSLPMSCLQIGYTLMKPKTMDASFLFLFQYPWAFDLKMLSSPILIVVFSTSLRDALRGILNRKGNRQMRTTAVTITANLSNL